MKKNFKIIFAVVALMALMKVNAQQLSLSTNYIMNAYAYNPAVSGSVPYTKVNGFYRNQWTGFEGAPQTYMLNGHGPIKKLKNATIGGMVFSDKTGLITTTAGYLSFAYFVNVNKKTRFGLGLQGGVNQFKVRLYDVRAYDQGDEVLTGNILTANAADAGAGLYLYSDKFFIGISDQHMMNNRVRSKYTNAGKVTPHLYGMIGYNIHAGKDVVIQPSILVKQNRNDYKVRNVVPPLVQPEYSLKITYKEFCWIGSSYRTRDGINFMAGVNVIKKLSVAYSYDHSLSDIKKYNQGSHEIMLSYTFVKVKKLDPDEEEMKAKDNSVHNSIKNKKTTTPQNIDDNKPKEEPKKDQ
jgi:type IX secretion system PorP/SprF family membrane protein